MFLSCPFFPDLADIGTQARADAFAERLHQLALECGLAMQLRDHGVTRESLPLLAEDAMKQTRLLVNNPRALTYDDAFAIYEKAW